MNDIVEICRSYQHTAKLIGIGEHTTIVPNKLKKKKSESHAFLASILEFWGSKLKNNLKSFGNMKYVHKSETSKNVGPFFFLVSTM